MRRVAPTQPVAQLGFGADMLFMFALSLVHRLPYLSLHGFA